LSFVIGLLLKFQGTRLESYFLGVKV